MHNHIKKTAYNVIQNGIIKVEIATKPLHKVNRFQTDTRKIFKTGNFSGKGIMID